MAAVFTMDQGTIHFSEKEIISGVSFTVSEGEKIGILGRNGEGKSTLLRLLAQEEKLDKGQIMRLGGITVGYLPQEPAFTKGLSVIEQTMAFVRRQNNAGAAEEYEARALLTRLGVTDMDKEAVTLSGGQRKCLALAAVLTVPADVLLLDEPTNHLDASMIEWLEQKLKAYRGTLLMVTHDRYFLNRICNVIFDVGGGRVTRYNANYQGYLEQKAQRMADEQATVRKQSALYVKELAWIRRGAQARSTKAKGRIQQFDELSDTLQGAKTQSRAAGTMTMESTASRLGKKILAWEDIALARGGKQLFSDFSYTLLRDDRIGIIGRNGCGKTGLLEVLSGECAPEKGTVERGDTVKLGIFRQTCPAENDKKSVLEAIRDIAEVVHTPSGTVTASQMLERFLFPISLQMQPVSKLSGGEKRRLYLLQVLMGAPNILFLDEPTNDLDIDTLTVLEDYLDTFQGALITVSHDRFFLDRTCSRLFAFDHARLQQFEGGFSDNEDALTLLFEDEDAPKTQKEKPAAPAPRKENVKKRFSFKEQRDYETIEGTIAAIEKQCDDIDREIDKNASDYVRIGELLSQKEEAHKKLDEAMERWMYLSELAEEIEKNQKKDG